MGKGKVAKRYMRMADVMRYTDLHYDTLRRMIKNGEFPEPVRLSQRVIMFDAVKIALRMGGTSMEDINGMTEEQLMKLHQTGVHSLDQIDPDGGDNENNPL